MEFRLAIAVHQEGVKFAIKQIQLYDLAELTRVFFSWTSVSTIDPNEKLYLFQHFLQNVFVQWHTYIHTWIDARPKLPV